MASRYFITSGAVTAVFPTQANLDTGATTTNTTYASSAFGANDSVRLMGIIIVQRAATTETMALVDKAGATILTLTGMTNAAAENHMFGPDGIPMPTGGFGVTTTVASTVYMFIIRHTASTYVANATGS